MSTMNTRSTRSSTSNLPKLLDAPSTSKETASDSKSVDDEKLTGKRLSIRLAKISESESIPDETGGKSNSRSAKMINMVLTEENVAGPSRLPKVRSKSGQISDTESIDSMSSTSTRRSTRLRKIDDSDDISKNATPTGKRSSSRLSQVESSEDLTVADKVSTPVRKSRRLSETSAMGSTEDLTITDRVLTPTVRRSTRRLSETSALGSTEDLTVAMPTVRRSTRRLSETSATGSTEDLTEKGLTYTGRRSSSRLSQVSGMGSTEDLTADKGAAYTARRGSRRFTQPVSTEDLTAADKIVGNRLPRIDECANLEDNLDAATTEKMSDPLSETRTSEKTSSVPDVSDIKSSPSKKVSSRLSKDQVLEDAKKVLDEPKTPRRTSTQIRKESETTSSEELEYVGEITLSSSPTSLDSSAKKTEDKEETIGENAKENEKNSGNQVNTEIVTATAADKSPVKRRSNSRPSPSKEIKQQASVERGSENDSITSEKITSEEDKLETSVSPATRRSRRSEKLNTSHHSDASASFPVVKLVDCRKLNVSDGDLPSDTAVTTSDSQDVTAADDLHSLALLRSPGKTKDTSEKQSVKTTEKESKNRTPISSPSKNLNAKSDLAASQSCASPKIQESLPRKSPRHQTRAEEAESKSQEKTEKSVDLRESPRKRSRESLKLSQENIAESSSEVQDVTPEKTLNDSVHSESDREESIKSKKRASTESVKKASVVVSPTKQKITPTKQKVSEVTKEDICEVDIAEEKEKSVKVQRGNDKHDSNAPELINLNYSDDSSDDDIAIEEVVAKNDSKQTKKDGPKTSEPSDDAKAESDDTIAESDNASAKSDDVIAESDDAIGENGDGNGENVIAVSDDGNSDGDGDENENKDEDASAEGNDKSNKHVTFSGDIVKPKKSPKKSAFAKLNDPEYVLKINSYITDVLDSRQKLKEISRFSDPKPLKKIAKKPETSTLPKNKPDLVKILDKSDGNKNNKQSTPVKREVDISALPKNKSNLANISDKSEKNKNQKKPTSTDGKLSETIAKKPEDSSLPKNKPNLANISEKPEKNKYKKQFTSTDSNILESVSEKCEIDIKKSKQVEKEKSSQNLHLFNREPSTGNKLSGYTASGQNSIKEKPAEKTLVQPPKETLPMKRKLEEEKPSGEALPPKKSKKSKKKKRKNIEECQVKKTVFDKAAVKMGFNVSDKDTAALKNPSSQKVFDKNPSFSVKSNTAELKDIKKSKQDVVLTSWGKVSVASNSKNLASTNGNKTADPANKWNIKPASADTAEAKKLKIFKAPETFTVTSCASKSIDSRLKFIPKSFKTDTTENFSANSKTSQLPHQTQQNSMSVKSLTDDSNSKSYPDITIIGKKKKRKRNKKKPLKENSTSVNLMGELVSNFLDKTKQSGASKNPFVKTADPAVMPVPKTQQVRSPDAKVVEKKMNLLPVNNPVNELKPGKARKLGFQDVFCKSKTPKASGQSSAEDAIPILSLSDKNKFIHNDPNRKRNLPTGLGFKITVPTKKPNLEVTKETEGASSEYLPANKKVKSLSNKFLESLTDQLQPDSLSQENNIKKKKNKNRKKKKGDSQALNDGKKSKDVLQHDFIPLSGGQAKFKVAVVDKPVNPISANSHFKNQQLQRKGLKREPVQNLLAYSKKQKMLVNSKWFTD